MGIVIFERPIKDRLALFPGIISQIIARPDIDQRFTVNHFPAYMRLYD